MADLNELRAKFPGYDDDLLLAANDMEEAEKTLPRRPNIASESAMRAYLSDGLESVGEDKPFDEVEFSRTWRGGDRGEPAGDFDELEFARNWSPAGAKAPKEDGFISSASRGAKNSFLQLPQLGYGLAAAAAAASELAFGEGGISTAAKDWAIRGYQDWGNKVAANSKENDDLNVAYDKAKQGDFGALVSWLGYGVGYTAGQAAQMLTTAGAGSVIGQAVAKGAVEKFAEGMVAKEAASLAGAGATKEAIAAKMPEAVAAVASKFGQYGALGVSAYGMEGGEIYGDLVAQAQKEGRQLTGADLARATGATVLAGTMEYGEDILGLHVLKGKLPFGKEMTGIGGRLARGGVDALFAAPIEAATEYGQTMTEEYGKGNDPFSEETRRQAIAAAGLGAVGGGVHGTVGGIMSAPKPADVSDVLTAPDLDTAIRETERLALPSYAGPALVTFPDGSTMTGAEAEQRRLAGMTQPVEYPTAEPINPERVAGIESERERLRGIMGGIQANEASREQADADLARQDEERRAQAEADFQRHMDEANAAKQFQIDEIARLARAQQADQAQQVSLANETEGGPTAMQLAFQRAKTQQPTQETPNGLQVQEADPAQEVALPDNPPALIVKRNGKGTLVVTGNADDVRAAEDRIKQLLPGVQIMRRVDHDGGVSLALGRTVNEKQAGAAIATINQEKGNAPVQAGPKEIGADVRPVVALEGQPLQQPENQAAPVPAPANPVAFNKRPDGTITVKGFTQEQIRTAAGAIGARVQVGSNGNAIFGKGTDLAKLKTALGTKEKAKPRGLTGNLRNDLNILAPGLYNEVAHGGDGEDNRRDMSLVAEYLQDQGYVLPKGKPSDAVVEMIRQDFANGGGTVNAERMVKAKEIEEAKRHRREVMAAADEYGVDTRDGIKPRPLEDIEADVEKAIEHEVGVAGKAYASVRAEALKAGIPDDEISSIEDRIADAYFGTGKQDADVLMYREMANAIQERIDGQESEEPARQSPVAESDQGVFELAGQTEGEARAEAVEPEITREQIDREATAPDGRMSKAVAPSEQTVTAPSKDEASRSQEQRSTQPVAESQAPAPSEPGDSGVAPTQASAVPVIPSSEMTAADHLRAAAKLMEGAPAPNSGELGSRALSNQDAGAASVRADESGALKEPAQSGGEAGPATIESHSALFDRVRAGEVTAEQFKAAFESAVKSKGMIEAELSAMTKDNILEQFPGLRYRYKNEKKDRVVRAAYDDMLTDFVLGQGFGYTMGANSYIDGIRAKVEKVTDELLAEYAHQYKNAIAEREQARKEAEAGMENPETLDDLKRVMAAKAREIGDGATFKQAYMALKPEWRAKYDELTAEQTRGERNALDEAKRTTVRAAGQEMEGQIVETKHTRTGEDLFVVKAAERVDREIYNQWNATAKRLAGWYSSYRGGGAVPGFQFKTRENAEAFLKYLGGDPTQAAETIQQRRDEFSDDKSQSAVERLTEMADKLDERADASLSQDRKTNTERRARMAGNAEAAANSEKALAQTMRNIADAIENKTAKFLNRIRQKSQVEMLQGMVATAQNEKLRQKYPSYAEQEKHKGEAPNGETAGYAEFPSYTAYRSDLASLGRALIETEGTKKIGQRLMKVADDVSAAYLKFAKENLHQVSKFSTRDGQAAIFKTKDDAEAAIHRSGYRGAAIVLPFKRGENLIIFSPSEAIKRGIWEGDNDKRITLSPDLGAEIVEKLGKMNRRKDAPAVPWQFESAYDKLKRLSAIGIERPAELRAALREFINLRESPKAPNRVKELERAMVGRKKDGLDFFPTAPDVVDEMLGAADIKEGMSVLEPSAGMGHIADQIREAGIEPDVGELSGDRRELLEAKGYRVVAHDFMSTTKADTPDGAGYDRIIMNPPFSDRRDAEHVQHAYSLLKPGGRIVAIMGEGVFFGSDKTAQGFRDWLESVGGTSEKLAEGSFMDPSLPVNTGVNARMVVIEKPSVALESRGGKAMAGDTFTSRVLNLLAGQDEFFQQPISEAKSIGQIAKEIAKNYLVKPLMASTAKREGADKAWEITVPGSTVRSGTVFEKGDKVWINVSRLRSGIDTGNVIYGIAAAYAHNNDKVFIGDPNGLSKNAFFRRTENMLSSALKFGTTRHLAPHFGQEHPGLYYPGNLDGEGWNYYNRAEGLKWEPGNDVGNIRNLIYTSYRNALAHAPEIKNVRYDFERQRFVFRGLPEGGSADGLRSEHERTGGESGAPVPGSFFDELSRRVSGREETGYRAGSATLKRSALLDTLLRERSEEGRRSILAQVSRQLSGRLDPALQGTFYSETAPERGLSSGVPENQRGLAVDPKERLAQVEQVRDAFVREYPGAEDLDIRVVLDRDQIPERLRPSPYAEGVYHDGLGLIYLIADNLPTKERAFQVLSHEVVGHAGLMSMMGDSFKPILGDVFRVARAKSNIRGSVDVSHPDYATVEAVRMDYPEVSDDVVAQEVLARMAETGGKQSVFKIAVMRIRKWLREFADRLGLKMDFTEQDARDLVALAGAHLRSGDNLGTETAGEGVFASKRLESRSHVTGASRREYSAEQLEAFKRTGRTVEVPTLKERVASLTDNWSMKLRQGIADQFAPLEKLDKHAYVQARLSKAYDGALEALMLYGKVKVDGGIYNADMSGGVLDRLMRPLGSEMDDFMWYVAAKRAERLSAEDREHLFTPEDIAAMKALATGETDFDYTLSNGKTTRSRELIYHDAAKVLDEFNKSVMDIAEQSGLIDGESRAIWERDFYIPFYRALEDEKVGGPGVKSGLVRQYAFKQLKGGSEALNHDLIANTLQNWAHLLAASAKNRAAASSLQAAKRVGVAEEVPAGTKGSVYYLDKGEQKHFVVSDPFLMDAIAAIEFAGFRGPVMKVMGKAKHYLTLGVTANPAFKIRNLIRDSIAAIGQSDININPVKNIAQGFKATDKKGQTYVSMLASGGIVKFGSMLEGNRADHVRQLIEEGVSEDTILDNESKIKAFWRRRIKPAIEAYNELGDRGESINRAALYEQMIARGMSHEEASYAARDLLDFSMGGTWQAVRLLTQVVPFMNARVQGLYKLGRSDKKRLGYVVGAVSLASLALLVAYGDDDDWKKREDWDRDNYWWFKFGGIAFRIPKPFEIGAIGTLAERSAELFFDNEMTGKRYMDRLGALVGNQLAMNPVPQLFKPIVDIYANKDSFSGRPIETMGMEKLRTEDRYNARTSEVAKILGKANLLSPVQIDQAIRGYFGWLGTATSGAIDYMARAADDTPRPEMKLRDVFLAGAFVETLPSNSSRYVSQMYDQAKEIEEAWASFQHYRKLGEVDKAKEILEDNRDALGRYHAIEAVKRDEAAINRKIQQVEASKSLSPETKRKLLDQLNAQRDRVARRVSA